MPKQQHLTLWETTMSVFASFVGIQSENNRIRDFERGKPLYFIIIGIIFTVVFVLSVLSLVFISI